MLFSHSPEESQLSLFTSFINTVIHGKSDHKNSVNKVLHEVHALATGEKNIRNIDRNNFSIIVKLKKTDEEYFRNLEVESMQPQDYNTVAGMLTRVK